MTRRVRTDEPSFSSINEKSFESRLVRIHPCTRTDSIGTALCKAFFIGVGERGLSIHFRQTINVQHSIRLRKATARQDAQHSTLNCSRFTLRTAELQSLIRAFRAAREVGSIRLSSVAPLRRLSTFTAPVGRGAKGRQ